SCVEDRPVLLPAELLEPVVAELPDQPDERDPHDDLVGVPHPVEVADAGQAGEQRGDQQGPDAPDDEDVEQARLQAPGQGWRHSCLFLTHLSHWLNERPGPIFLQNPSRARSRWIRLAWNCRPRKLSTPPKYPPAVAAPLA